MAAAFADADLVEFIGGSPYVDGILAEPFELDAEGYLAIPERPGLGVTLDPGKLARFAPKSGRLFP
jgi:L-alanine-DL-glutamate epimerase-like enolase superfamily enzyme